MRLPKSERGSVLIVAAIFAIIIAIALASYLQVGRNSMKLANRSFYFNAAVNLTDIGLEQALWSLNHADWTGAGFTARGGYASEWQGTFPSPSAYYQFAPGAKGQVKVWVDTSGTTPHAVAEAIVTLGDGTTVVKEAEVYMKNRSYFANGLVAKNQITFSGNNAEVDSWNSDPDNNPSTPAVAYIGSGPGKNSHDSGQVGSTSVQVDSISVSNANIYGFVAVGGHTLDDISVGPQGMVGPYGTPNGTIDTTHVTYDFTTSFPDASAPDHSTSLLSPISGSLTLPLGSPPFTGTYYYSVASITLGGNSDMLTIAQGVNVVLVVTNTIGPSVSVSGNHAGIYIPTGSSLALYTSGNVNIAGTGVVNGTYNPANPLSATNTPNEPIAFRLYGTRTSADAAMSGEQSIKIAGNGVLSGVVFAPNADIEMKGGGNSGQILGSMVGHSVAVTGNSTFHYDESLVNDNSSNLWTLSKWRELVLASDRSAYAGALNF